MDFNTWMIFGAVIFYLHTASSAPFVSTISKGYMSIESGSSFFTCYRRNNASVQTDGYVRTHSGGSKPANVPPPPSTRILVGNPPTEVYRTNFSPYPNASFGFFYCASTAQAGRTVVPTIFIRSDAKFVPTNDRFSKTVNKGDTNVTVEFTELPPSELKKKWMFDGTTDLGENGDWQFSRQSTNLILEEVDTSHAGVYEVFLEGETGHPRSGLLRLIVRACPAGRYNTTSGCMKTCPSCYNGGICHDETGKCVCPPGFRGPLCGIACGGNRHGRSCRYKCDYSKTANKTACRGFQVCVPDPYGCSCTVGYKGLDCTTECDGGEFGASCTETCHCVSGECDRFTGVCTGSSTECQPGWIGDNCQVKSRFTSGLIVSRTTSASVTLRWGSWHDCREVDSPPLQYHVYYRQANLNESFEKRFSRTDHLGRSETVTGLSADTDYVFGVEPVIDELRRKEKRLEVLGSTKCSAPDGVPMAMIASSSTHPRTIQVSWQNSQLEANCRSGYTGVRIYWDAVGSSSSSSHGSVVVSLNASMGYNLTAALEPYTRYRISAAMLNRDAEGPRCEPSEAMTAEESGGGFSLRTVLIGSIIPSAIALACIITLLSLIVRKQAPDNRSSKAEDMKKNAGSATKSQATNVYEEGYETVLY